MVTRATFLEIPLESESIEELGAKLAHAARRAAENDLAACRAHWDERHLELVKGRAFEDDLLEVANKLRALHGMKPLPGRAP